MVVGGFVGQGRVTLVVIMQGESDLGQHALVVAACSSWASLQEGHATHLEFQWGLWRGGAILTPAANAGLLRMFG